VVNCVGILQGSFWFWLGWPAFLSVLVIFWRMIAKPA
jgi:uncharacterized membrane protein